MCLSINAKGGITIVFFCHSISISRYCILLHDFLQFYMFYFTVVRYHISPESLPSKLSYPSCQWWLSSVLCSWCLSVCILKSQSILNFSFSTMFQLCGSTSYYFQAVTVSERARRRRPFYDDDDHHHHYQQQQYLYTDFLQKTKFIKGLQKKLNGSLFQKGSRSPHHHHPKKGGGKKTSSQQFERPCARLKRDSYFSSVNIRGTLLEKVTLVQLAGYWAQRRNGVQYWNNITICLLHSALHLRLITLVINPMGTKRTIQVGFIANQMMLNILLWGLLQKSKGQGHLSL